MNDEKLNQALRTLFEQGRDPDERGVLSYVNLVSPALYFSSINRFLLCILAMSTVPIVLSR
jgi:hypothetical protein